jgi:(1->4)-alpha-D-glucan 1-alpha-D-glucosylmutase
MTMTTERSPRFVPRSTYRLQFNGNFSFRQATALVPYLESLGISDLYASPYLKARPGSLHGYDISDHNELNPEIGTEQDHAEMVAALRSRGMGQLLDIVPNHMGIGEPSNLWWMDLLENGPSSRYARFFDIDWEPLKRELHGKILLPVLGDHYGRVLERGELRLSYEDGRFMINYFDNCFPVAPKSSAAILRLALELMGDGGEEEHPDRLELESIVTALEHLPSRVQTDRASVSERRREKRITQRRLAELAVSSPLVHDAVERAIDRMNGTPGEPSSFDLLQTLLDDQAYRLAYWRVAAEEINYRRFFDINDLAGLRVERAEVFEETHRLILRLLAEGKVTGLRIDHPDGLFDPAGYLDTLQARAPSAGGDDPLYLLVEKILTGDETLPNDWPVAGTVGYDLMDRINRLFVPPRHEEAMDAAYARFVRRLPDFEELVYQGKKLILRSALASELNVLANRLDRLSERNRRSRDYTLGILTDVLREMIACFPVYRTYIDVGRAEVSQRDREYIEQATAVAIRRNRSTSASVFHFVRDTLLLRWPEDLDAEERAEHAEFVMKLQQLTGPVMAKGVEDTCFYMFNRLVSLNEVGGQPERFGIDLEAFHRFVARRAEHWPHAMNSSSTHDTKRSEDVRARIHVLSEIPEIWAERAALWAHLNAGRRPQGDGYPIPDPNDEYLLYQTLVGAWPLEGPDAVTQPEFVGRIQQYMEKATREAKVHTSWINPNDTYDEGLREFIGRILERDPKNEFLHDFAAFHEEYIAVAGMLNALSQTLLKLTLPGVPDIYQGQERWDFSLVDPDNRRPVDFDACRSALERIQTRLAAVDRSRLSSELLREWRGGDIKMYVTHLALDLRRRRSHLFQHGSYQPLAGSGPSAEHIVAFARARDPETVATIVPRWPLVLGAGAGLPSRIDWGDTSILVPPELRSAVFRNVLTGEPVAVGRKGELGVAELLASFPIALLESE